MRAEPPDYLSHESKDLWREVVPRHDRGPGWLVILTQALITWDRCEEARKELEVQGLTTVTEATGAVHLNPLVKVERECRQQFIRLWSELGLSWDIEIDRGWSL